MLNFNLNAIKLNFQKFSKTKTACDTANYSRENEQHRKRAVDSMVFEQGYFTKIFVNLDLLSKNHASHHRI